MPGARRIPFLRNLCPRCSVHPIFRGLRMAPCCASCGYVYAREPGYFIGAMVFSYVFGAFSVVPTLVAGILVLQMEIAEAVALASLQVILLAPLLFRASRLAWINVDFRADPPRALGHGERTGGRDGSDR